MACFLPRRQLHSGVARTPYQFNATGWRIGLAADEPHEYQHDYEDDHGVDDDGATDHPNHPSSDFRLGFPEAPQEVGPGLTEVRLGRQAAQVHITELLKQGGECLCLRLGHARGSQAVDRSIGVEGSRGHAGPIYSAAARWIGTVVAVSANVLPCCRIRSLRSRAVSPSRSPAFRVIAAASLPTARISEAVHCRQSDTHSC